MSVHHSSSLPGHRNRTLWARACSYFVAGSDGKGEIFEKGYDAMKSLRLGVGGMSVVKINVGDMSVREIVEVSGKNIFQSRSQC